MALMDMSIKKHVHQVQQLMDHCFAGDSIGNLILIALHCLQLKSGCGFHLLEQPSEGVSYITQC
jgi:hypothetical protein